MIIPDIVRISCIAYRVEHRADLNDGEKVLYGQVDYGKSTIQLNSANQNHQFECVTLWHEILHAISTHTGLELGDDTEKIIDIFAHGIYQVLQDNGGLFRPGKAERSK